MDMAVTDRTRNYPTPKTCEYCGFPVVFASNAEIYGRKFGNGLCYRCMGCDAYVGVHTGTKIPLGRLANKELRELKMKAHGLFDLIWKSKSMSRACAYKWLADAIGIPVNECHFGWFDKETLNRAIAILGGRNER